MTESHQSNSKADIDRYFAELYYVATGGQPSYDEEGFAVAGVVSQEALEFFKNTIHTLENPEKWLKPTQNIMQDIRDALLVILIERVKSSVSSYEVAYEEVSNMALKAGNGEQRSLGLGTDALKKIHINKRKTLQDYQIAEFNDLPQEELESFLAALLKT